MLFHTASALLSLLITTYVSAASIPSQLFSPLVPSKILNTTRSLPAALKYPQYTDQTAGAWQLFSPDTWTSGFFPSTLYALNTRTKLCAPTQSNGLAAADWLTLARSVSTGEVPLEAGNNQGHDQGFLSFPFMQELLV
jgi:hypothetical protein